MLLGPLHLGLIVGLKQRAPSGAISDMAPRVESQFNHCDQSERVKAPVRSPLNEIRPDFFALNANKTLDKATR
jgi:hypothetical protein